MKTTDENWRCRFLICPARKPTLKKSYNIAKNIIIVETEETIPSES